MKNLFLFKRPGFDKLRRKLIRKLGGYTEFVYAPQVVPSREVQITPITLNFVERVSSAQIRVGIPGYIQEGARERQMAKMLADEIVMRGLADFTVLDDSDGGKIYHSRVTLLSPADAKRVGGRGCYVDNE